MPNMETLIKSHNATVLNPQPQNEIVGCNCRNPATCPLRGNCQSARLVYSATVTTVSEEKIYYGSTKGKFKKRYDRHNSDFRHREHRKATELSKLIWDLKDANIEYTIRWDVVLKAQPYVGGSKRCDLCLSEKMIIARSTHPGMINSRSKILSKCRHTNNFILKNT